MRRALIALMTGMLLAAAAGCSKPPASQESAGDPTPSAQEASVPPASSAVPGLPEKTPAPSVLEKVEFFSAALGTKKKMRVYLPHGYDTSRRYPVLYMLHGYNGTENAWMPEMQLDKTADRLIEEGSIAPLIIVSPEMNNSYGLNSSETYRVADPKHPKTSRYYGRYEDYFIQDVIPYVDKHYSTNADKEGRYVGGFSMGGFISLHVAFRHPELFSKAGGHSPALWLDDWSRVPRMKPWLYPTAAMRKERDPVELARTADLAGMSVYLDCGDKDDFKLYDGSEKLFGILQARGVSSEYHLNPGTHSRTYWKSRTEDYLLFYAGHSSGENLSPSNSPQKDE